MLGMIVKLAIIAVLGLLAWRALSLWFMRMTGKSDPPQSGHQSGVTDMVACPVCHTFVIVGDKTRCGRPNCPGL